MNHSRKILPQISLLLAAISLSACARQPPPPAIPAGTWHATVKNNSGENVAFLLEIAAARSGAPAQATVTLVNGDDRLTSTDATFDGTTLTAHYSVYDATLTAKLDGNQLRGTFDRQWEKQKLSRELTATKDAPRPPAADRAPNLTGDWILKVGEAPNQRLWRAAFHTSGTTATGTIIPVSGDWGTMTGTVADDGTLTLNRFDGINSRFLKITLQPDGTLTGLVDLGLKDPTRKVIAERITDRNQALVADLPDPNNHIRMNNASEPLRFSFPDVDGKTLAWDDPRFKNKVVIVTITGTWCPACHEEAPFLQDLYSRYKSQGLEIVSLAFEYTGDRERDGKQVRIFAQQHGIQYPVLLAGSTDDGPAKMPQLVNFGAYPTAIFIGRDGLVKRIHTGFEGKATGERHTKLKSEVEGLIKELLAGKTE